MLDLDLLLKLRLVVARYGEMDIARWWNTQGMLGRYGRVALTRGLPQTHHFAQARVVFGVARHRCEEVLDVPGSVTLWTLPARHEEQFDAKWQHWLDESDDWSPFFENLESLGDDLIPAMDAVGIIEPQQVEATGRLRRSAGGRGVQLPGVHRCSDELMASLAAGFARGEPGRLAVPYAKLEDGADE